MQIAGLNLVETDLLAFHPETPPFWIAPGLMPERFLRMTVSSKNPITPREVFETPRDICLNGRRIHSVLPYLDGKTVSEQPDNDNVREYPETLEWAAATILCNGTVITQPLATVRGHRWMSAGLSGND